MKADKNLLKRLSELDISTAVPPCTINQLSPALVERLILAQKMCGVPFTINCGYRSQAYDRAKGRSGTSAHCRTNDGKPCSLAVDVSAIDSHTRFKVLVGAVLAGIPRIGVGKRFLHLDIDETKPHPIIFHYYE